MGSPTLSHNVMNFGPQTASNWMCIISTLRKILHSTSLPGFADRDQQTELNHTLSTWEKQRDCSFVRYQTIRSALFSVVTKHACDRWTDRQTDGKLDRLTDGQNYDSQDRASTDNQAVKRKRTESHREIISPYCGEFPTQPNSTKIGTCLGVADWITRTEPCDYQSRK